MSQEVSSVPGNNSAMYERLSKLTGMWSGRSEPPIVRFRLYVCVRDVRINVEAPTLDGSDVVKLSYSQGMGDRWICAREESSRERRGQNKQGVVKPIHAHQVITTRCPGGNNVSHVSVLYSYYLC